MSRGWWVRALKNRWFEKFARKQEISDAALIEAIDRAEGVLLEVRNDEGL
jgi:hypothetical protein